MAEKITYSYLESLIERQNRAEQEMLAAWENGSFTFWNMNAKRDILLKNYCTRTPGGENTSLGCGALILQDNWEIKDDYPW